MSEAEPNPKKQKGEDGDKVKNKDGESSSDDEDNVPLVAAVKKEPVKKETTPAVKKEASTSTPKDAKSANGVTKKETTGNGTAVKKESTSTVKKESGVKSEVKGEVKSEVKSEEKSDEVKSETKTDAKKATPTKPTTTKSPAATPNTNKRGTPARAAASKKKKTSDDDSSSSSSDSSSSSSDSSSSEDESGEEDNEKSAAKKAKKFTKGLTSIKLNDASKYEQREAVILKARKGALRWWDRTEKELMKDPTKWKTLEHNGPIFPPPYVPHKVPLIYNGDNMVLHPASEEVATFYASMLETDFIKKATFNKNFFRDWQTKMTKEEKSKITDLTKCDFREIHKHLVKERDTKKEKNKEPEMKKQIKAEKDRLMEVYGVALVDGQFEKVGNFRVEPPALFRGRGEHPKTGTLKRRVVPEDITINIGKDVPIPKCPEGHNWKGVVHDQSVTWLAYWQDNVNGDYKYVYLAASSRFKGQADRAKYGKAIELKKHIGKIRDNYEREMTSNDKAIRQRATALYLIDKLALRVGNEKDTDSRADTVGLCSLRVEHIKFPEENKIHLYFLGKDSMVYDNTVGVPPKVYTNLKQFCVGKKQSADIFDTLTPELLNKYLKSIMDGLSAKVFRTYNASITLEQELFEKPEEDDCKVDDLEAQKVLFYNRANREVAILCNHQRSVPKGFEGQFAKLTERSDELQKQLKELQDHLATLTGKKKGSKKEAAANLPSSVDACETKLTKLQLTIENHETKMALKSDTKTVALGTSKINYMDPRITVAWCKAKEVPLEKVFNKSLITKFPWAMETPATWRF